LARDVDVTIIDTDVEMIQSAAEFGFKVYYGDGTRLDVLHASGARTARAIAVCTDKRNVTDRIVELCKNEFPQAKLLVRSFDREHALKLINTGVDFQIRETFESALAFGEVALRELGVPDTEAAEIAAEIRRRDAERFSLELATNDSRAGIPLMFSNVTPRAPKPTPFTVPRRESRALNEEAASATRHAVPEPAATSD
jgi:glutathione-regulated potassium-efflux system protein KefB